MTILARMAERKRNVFYHQHHGTLILDDEDGYAKLMTENISH